MQFQSQSYSAPSGRVVDWSRYSGVERPNKPAQWDRVLRGVQETSLAADDHTIIRDYASPAILQLVVDVKNEPVWPAGYQMALWELREGHLRWCDAAARLYRRDPDPSIEGVARLQVTWHQVGDIDSEFAVARSERNERVCKTLELEARRSEWFRQAYRGIRVGNRAWVRDDESQPVRFISDCAGQDLAITQTLPDDGDTPAARREAERRALGVLTELTDGETTGQALASRANLARMLTNPFLEPSKLHTYVLSGSGGNGKSLLVRYLLENVLGERRVVAFDAAGYLGVAGGYDRADQMSQMDGALFAVDDETPPIYENMIAPLRGLSTGRKQYARVIQGQGRMVRPTATIVLLTNEIFYDSDRRADARRFVKVQFAPAARHSASDWNMIRRAFETNPQAFYAVSARVWQEEGDEPRPVQLAPTRLTERQGWIVNELETQREKTGIPLASRQEYRRTFHANVADSLLTVMGLSTVYTRQLSARRTAALTVSDPQRYQPWLALWQAQQETSIGR